MRKKFTSIVQVSELLFDTALGKQVTSLVGSLVPWLKQQQMGFTGRVLGTGHTGPPRPFPQASSGSWLQKPPLIDVSVRQMAVCLGRLGQAG